MKLNYIFLFTLFLYLPLFAQDYNENTILANFENLNNTENEKVYIHTNKQKFVKGEKLWFTAYVRNKDAYIHSILWLGLYDNAGKMLKKNAYYLEDGIATGDLKLELPKGQYFLKANVGPENKEDLSTSFIQRVTVNIDAEPELSPAARSKVLALKTKTSSKNLVPTVANTVYYHIDSWNQEIDFLRQVRVIDMHGKIAEELSTTDNSGVGSITFLPELNKKYLLEVELYGDILLKSALPEIVDEGILVTINPNLSKDVLIHLQQIGNTTNDQGNEHTFSFVSDSDVKVANVYWTSTEKAIKFPKSDIPEGLNLFSLFDRDNNLIAHQLFYNEIKNKSKLNPFQVSNKEIKNDSVFIELEKKQLQSAIKNASISVVPLEYENIDNDLSILNHDLAASFANKDAHKASNFFKIAQKRDIALLNVALASVEASEFWKPKNSTTEKEFNRRFGFSVKGRARITGIHEKRQIFLLQKSVGSFYSAQLSSSGDFHFRNVIIDKNNPLNFVVKLGKKELNNPKIEFDITPEVSSDSIPPAFLKRYAQTGSGTIAKDIERRITFTKDQKLDEVVVVGKKKQDPFRNSLLEGAFEYKKIDKEDYRKRRTLSQFIRALGFNVVSDPEFFGNIVILGRGQFDQPPVVYEDGFRVNSLSDVQLDTIEEIYFEHQGIEGSDGGTIYIYRRYDLLNGKDKAVSKQVKPDTGFQFALPYKNPIGKTYFTSSLKKFASVHWEPSIKFEADDKVIIGFPSYGLEGVKYVINGITNENESLYQEGQLLFNE